MDRRSITTTQHMERRLAHHHPTYTGKAFNHHHPTSQHMERRSIIATQHVGRKVMEGRERWRWTAAGGGDQERRRREAFNHHQPNCAGICIWYIGLDFSEKIIPVLHITPQSISKNASCCTLWTLVPSYNLINANRNRSRCHLFWRSLL